MKTALTVWLLLLCATLIQLFIEAESACDQHCVSGCKRRGPGRCDRKCANMFGLRRKSHTCGHCGEHCAGSCNVGGPNTCDNTCKVGYGIHKHKHHCKRCSSICAGACNKCGPGKCDGPCKPGYKLSGCACVASGATGPCSTNCLTCTRNGPGKCDAGSCGSGYDLDPNLLTCTEIVCAANCSICTSSGAGKCDAGGCDTLYELNTASLICQLSPVLVQQRPGTAAFFSGNWDRFKVGFGDPSSYYWMGNDRLHNLTSTGLYKLRFDLLNQNDYVWYAAEYDSVFVADETDGYRITLGTFSGNVTCDAMNEPGKPQNGQKFSTSDQDNDLSSRNCAALSDTGFWFNDCYDCGINEGMLTTGYRWCTMPLERARMWLT